MLPQKAVEEFKKLYTKHYDVELSNGETARRADSLMALFRAVYKNNNNQIKNGKRI